MVSQALLEKLHSLNSPLSRAGPSRLTARNHLPGQSDDEVVNQLSETQQTASKEESGQTTNVDYKIRLKSVSQVLAKILTQNISKWKQNVPSQLHLWIVYNSPLQIRSQEPDPRPLNLKWIISYLDSKWLRNLQKFEQKSWNHRNLSDSGNQLCRMRIAFQLCHLCVGFSNLKEELSLDLNLPLMSATHLIPLKSHIGKMRPSRTGNEKGLASCLDKLWGKKSLEWLLWYSDYPSNDQDWRVRTQSRWPCPSFHVILTSNSRQNLTESLLLGNCQENTSIFRQFPTIPYKQRLRPSGGALYVKMAWTVHVPLVRLVWHFRIWLLR